MLIEGNPSSLAAVNRSCYGVQPGIPNAIFHIENIKLYSMDSFPPIFSRYLFTLLILNCKFKIIFVPQIYHRITSLISFWPAITTPPYPKITWQIFTCIIIHQIFVLPKLLRRHSTLNPEFLGVPLDPYFPIPIKKQQLDNIQITPRLKMLSLTICSPTTQ